MTEGPTMPETPFEASQPEANPHNDTQFPLYQADYDGLHRTEYRPPAPYREIALAQADYERFRAFVLEEIGLDFSEDKRSMLGRGLAQVMEATLCQSVDQLYTLLRASSTTSAAWDLLISALTVGETYFFRHSNHFDTLATSILPEIMAQRDHTSRRIRIWSAACASGEEPYSIAILLRERIPDIESWNILILATDINREALEKARQGLYGAWSFRGVEKRIQDTYFHRQGNQFAIAEEIKRMVTFDYLNLVGDCYPSLANNTNAMDVILCRNVTIYFSAPVTQQVVRGFYSCLVDGGWLIPGPSEPNMVFYTDFEARNFPGTVVYQKPAASKTKAQPERAPFVPRLQQPVFASQPPVPLRPQATKVMSTAPVGLPLEPLKKNGVVPRPKTTPTPPDAYPVALELLKAGQMDEALAKLHEKLHQDANFVPTYFTLGKIYANKGDLEYAKHWCEQAVRLDKLRPEPYHILSMIYQEHGKLDLALDALKKTVYLDREFILAHYSLAQIYIRLGEKDLARKSLQNVQRLLEGKPRDALIPEGDGLIVGRLLELVEAHLASHL